MMGDTLNNSDLLWECHLTTVRDTVLPPIRSSLNRVANAGHRCCRKKRLCRGSSDTPQVQGFPRRFALGLVSGIDLPGITMERQFWVAGLSRLDGYVQELAGSSFRRTRGNTSITFLSERGTT